MLEQRPGPVVDAVDGTVEQLGEPGDAVERPAGHAGLVGPAQPVEERQASALDPGVDATHRGVAHAALGHVEHPLHADLVGGVDHRLQVGERVLDLAPVVEPGAADDPVRDAAPGQVLLDDPGLGVGPVEDRDVSPADVAGLVERRDALGDPLGLVVLVLGVVAQDLVARPRLGPQVLGLATHVVGDHRVGGVEHRLGGPVVLHQRDRGDVGERLLELEDVGDVGASEAVDRLVPIAHDGDVAVLLGQLDDQLVLDLVGVLVLVDEDVGKALAVVGEHVGVAAEQLDGVEEDVVEVHGAGPEQAGLVLAVDVGELALGEGAGPVGVLVDEHVVVLRRADLGVHRAGRQLLGVQVQVPQDVAGEADGVGLVVDRERGREADGIRVAAQDAHAGRVERGHPHLLGHRADEGADAGLHLVGGLVGEGDGQDLERADALLLDEPGDAPGEDPRLARAGAGEHEQRPAEVGDRLLLGRVQAIEQGRAERAGAGTDAVGRLGEQLVRRLARQGFLGRRRHRGDPTGHP